MFATIRLPPHFEMLFSFVGLLWLAVGGLLIYAVARLRDTTLAWPLVWCVAAWFVFSVALLSTPIMGTDFPSYIAAVTIVSPTLALLGAKRPQNGVWQFIVATMLGILLFPVLKGYAFGDHRTQVPTLYRWLICAHIVIGFVNYLPTRFAVPATLFGTAQYFICRSYLPFSSGDKWNDYSYALPCLIGAFFWAEWSADFGPNAAPLPGMSRLWRDFRDAYGLVWGLRVAERLNAAATKHRWRVEFTWYGIVGDPHSELRSLSGELLLVKLDPELRHRIERELRSHLRRFVSHEWIVRRLTPEASSASEPRT